MTYDVSATETIVLTETTDSTNTWEPVEVVDSIVIIESTIDYNTWYPVEDSETVAFTEDNVLDGDYYEGLTYNISDSETITFTEASTFILNLNTETIALIENSTIVVSICVSETISLTEDYETPATIWYITATAEIISMTDYVTDILTLREYRQYTSRAGGYLDHMELLGKYGLTVILPVPLFGNSELYDQYQIRRTNKFEEATIIFNEDLPLVRSVVMQFTNISQSQLDDLKYFISLNMGCEIDVTDYEYKTYRVIMENNLEVEEIAQGSSVNSMTEGVCGPLYNAQLMLKGLIL